MRRSPAPGCRSAGRSRPTRSRSSSTGSGGAPRTTEDDMTRRTILPALLLAAAFPLAAQAPPAASAPQETPAAPEPPADWDPGYGDRFLQTSSPLANEAGLFQVLFTHRFNQPVNEAGGNNLGGFDSGANIAIG